MTIFLLVSPSRSTSLVVSVPVKVNYVTVAESNAVVLWSSITRTMVSAGPSETSQVSKAKLTPLVKQRNGPVQSVLSSDGVGNLFVVGSNF